MYLHRILNLEDSDPVHEMFRNQQSFSEAGEENWWSGVQELLQKYNISMTLEEIKSVSKPRFRWVVKTAIEQFAFKQLTEECTALKKTADIRYTTFELQPYLMQLYPNRSRVVCKLRSKTLDIKSHQPHKYEDSVCRQCGAHDETVEHIVNCCNDSVPLVNVNELGNLDAAVKTDIISMVKNITEFTTKFSK